MAAWHTVKSVTYFQYIVFLNDPQLPDMIELWNPDQDQRSQQDNSG